jgi:hypothetical protein
MTTTGLNECYYYYCSRTHSRNNSDSSSILRVLDNGIAGTIYPETATSALFQLFQALRFNIVGDEQG